MSKLEERGIRDYVLTQTLPVDPDAEVTVVQKVGRRRVEGTTHDLYDVWMKSGTRYWVITEHTNYYSQEQFSSINEAFTYHLGFMKLTNEIFRTQPDPEAEPATKAWRRYSRAVEAMVEAEEAEDFQAVGIRCREALLALSRDYMDAEWVKVPEERPKAGDAKGWMRIYADSLSTGRQRDYVRAMAERTWDLTVSLQHYADATEWDAEIALGATQQLFKTFALLMARHRHGLQDRCPECDSYQLEEDWDEEFTATEGRVGKYFWNVCASCGWQSEKEWDNWTAERLQRFADYIDGKWRPPRRSMEELDPDVGGD